MKGIVFATAGAAALAMAVLSLSTSNATWAQETTATNPVLNGAKITIDGTFPATGSVTSFQITASLQIEGNRLIYAVGKSALSGAVAFGSSVPSSEPTTCNGASIGDQTNFTTTASTYGTHVRYDYRGLTAPTKGPCAGNVSDFHLVLDASVAGETCTFSLAENLDVLQAGPGGGQKKSYISVSNQPCQVSYPLAGAISSAAGTGAPASVPVSAPGIDWFAISIIVVVLISAGAVIRLLLNRRPKPQSARPKGVSPPFDDATEHEIRKAVAAQVSAALASQPPSLQVTQSVPVAKQELPPLPEVPAPLPSQVVATSSPSQSTRIELSEFDADTERRIEQEVETRLRAERQERRVQQEIEARLRARLERDETL